MLKSKEFLKLNRKGNVIKVIKEHYLRHDIGCGLAQCHACSPAQPLNPLHKVILSSEPFSSSKVLNGRSYYLILDTNIFLHQMDVLEHPALRDVIVLETALEEVRHRQFSVYHRLRKLITQVDRRFYVFLNEHHEETYVDTSAGESPNDRNDRAIRIATQWYSRHLSALNANGPSVLLLSNDQQNLSLARGLNLDAMTLKEYVSLAFPDILELQDMVAEQSTLNTAEEILYENHLTTSELLMGLKHHRFLQGTLNVNLFHPQEATVNVHGQSTPYLVQSRLHMNRGMHDDKVVIQVLPEAEWSFPTTRLDTTDQHHKSNDVDTTDGSEDQPVHVKENDEVATENVEQKKVPSAKVVGILKRAWRAYAGSIEYTERVAASSVGGVSNTINVLFTPFERRIPRIRLRTRNAAALASQRIVVAIDQWDRRARYPEGHYVRSLGPIGDKNAETSMLLIENDVIDRAFSPAVLACLPSHDTVIFGDRILQEDPSRIDFRHLNVCSIDPPGCTDIDDALHVRILPNGNYEVGVHIADVSHYVVANSAMDIEASERGTTVYLVDKRIDMLPELLGSNLCSLKADVDRLAFSCIWEMKEDASIINVQFCKSVIRSRHSFTYEEAQVRIDNSAQQDTITLGLRTLNLIAKQLRAIRMKAGALTLASPEVKIHLERESQDPLDVEMKELRETNALVEEFMLLANITVAQRIASRFPDCALLRRHPTPALVQFEAFIRAAKKKLNVDIDPSSSKQLADSLDAAVIPSNPYMNTLLRILTTRCMTQAVYFCSGRVSSEEYLHYGLAATIYTHFTSPIRRYADLVVHRLLGATLASSHGGPTSVDIFEQNRMEKICENLNYRHRNAQLAARSSVELFTVLYFKEKVMTETAYIIRVLKNGVIVLIPKYGIEGIVYLKEDNAITNMNYLQEEDMLMTSDGRVKLEIFQKITVRITIDRSNLQRQKLQLDLVSPYIAGISVEYDDKETESNKRQKMQ